jgi:hypothetical protein
MVVMRIYDERKVVITPRLRSRPEKGERGGAKCAGLAALEIGVGLGQVVLEVEHAVHVWSYDALLHQLPHLLERLAGAKT